MLFFYHKIIPDIIANRIKVIWGREFISGILSFHFFILFSYYLLGFSVYVGGVLYLKLYLNEPPPRTWGCADRASR